MMEAFLVFISLPFLAIITMIWGLLSSVGDLLSSSTTDSHQWIIAIGTVASAFFFYRSLKISRKTHEEILRQQAKNLEKQIEFEKKKHFQQPRVEFLEKNLKILSEIFSRINTAFIHINLKQFFVIFSNDFEAYLDDREFFKLIMKDEINIEEFKNQFAGYIVRKLPAIFKDEALQKAGINIEGENITKYRQDYARYYASQHAIESKHLNDYSTKNHNNFPYNLLYKDGLTTFDNAIKIVFYNNFGSPSFNHFGSKSDIIFFDDSLDGFLLDEELNFLDIKEKDKIVEIREECKSIVSECKDFFYVTQLNHRLQTIYKNIVNNEGDDKLRTLLHKIKKDVEYGLKYFKEGAKNDLGTSHCKDEINFLQKTLRECMNKEINF